MYSGDTGYISNLETTYANLANTTVDKETGLKVKDIVGYQKAGFLGKLWMDIKSYVTHRETMEDRVHKVIPKINIASSPIFQELKEQTKTIDLSGKYLLDGKKVSGYEAKRVNKYLKRTEEIKTNLIYANRDSLKDFFVNDEESKKVVSNPLDPAVKKYITPVISEEDLKRIESYKKRSDLRQQIPEWEQQIEQNNQKLSKLQQNLESLKGQLEKQIEQQTEMIKLLAENNQLLLMINQAKG